MPLLVVCLGAIVFLLRDILRRPTPGSIAIESPAVSDPPLLPRVRKAQTPGRTQAATPVQAITGSEIAGRIILKGTPPPEVNLPLDASCSRLGKVKATTRFYLVDASGGLADVFVYIKEGLQAKGDQEALPSVLLDQIDCQYVPYVLGLQTGQKLLVRNSDPTTHNVHPTPMIEGNKESSRNQPQGAANLEFIFTKPEVFVRFACNIHSWMYAYVGVVDHPFFAVSGQDGTFRIANVPPGTYTIEANHRKAGRSIQEIKLGNDERVEIEFIFELPNSAEASAFQPQSAKGNAG
jgi:hypothetical protein